MSGQTTQLPTEIGNVNLMGWEEEENNDDFLCMMDMRGRGHRSKKVNSSLVLYTIFCVQNK